MRPDQPTCVVLNAGAGFDDKTEAVDVVRKVFDECGSGCEITRLEPGTNIQTLVSKAVRAGAKRVVAGGGDGTLRAVASVLSGTDTVMGVLPVGTLNHFARDMEIPLDLEQAAKIAATGEIVNVDVADVNGHIFLNNSTFGLYPFYRAQREAGESSGLPKLWAVFRAVLRTVWRYPNLTLRLRMKEGGDVLSRTPYVLVANNAHALEGFRPWERESMTEGRLWIYIMKDSSRWGILRMLLKVATGRPLAFDELEAFRAEEVTIETRRRRLKVSVDGEVLPMSTPLRFRSRPGELRVVVPHDSKRLQEAASPAQECKS